MVGVQGVGGVPEPQSDRSTSVRGRRDDDARARESVAQEDGVAISPSVNEFTWQVVQGGQVELTFSEFNKKTVVQYQAYQSASLQQKSLEEVRDEFSQGSAKPTNFYPCQRKMQIPVQTVDKYTARLLM